jgi:hypothetical protein
MTRLAGAIERRGSSIATKGGATSARCIAIEKQARAIAIKTLATERRDGVRVAHLSVNEGINQPKGKTDKKHHHIWEAWGGCQRTPCELGHPKATSNVDRDDIGEPGKASNGVRGRLRENR